MAGNDFVLARTMIGFAKPKRSIESAICRICFLNACGQCRRRGTLRRANILDLKLAHLTQSHFDANNARDWSKVQTSSRAVRPVGELCEVSAKVETPTTGN
jgi:hypothetical protein